jgi:hypothetical protein
VKTSLKARPHQMMFRTGAELWSQILAYETKDNIELFVVATPF